MQAYSGLTAYYGDLHNHCDISYGRGTLEEAFLNAREQLGFCSVTGHALWPDMPEPDESIRHITEFHEESFARLRDRWSEVQRTTAAHHRHGEFVTFLSFQMHSCADGDHTVLYRGSQGDILEVEFSHRVGIVLTRTAAPLVSEVSSRRHTVHTPSPGESATISWLAWRSDSRAWE